MPKCPGCKRPFRTCYGDPCVYLEMFLESSQTIARWFRNCGLKALAVRKVGAAEWTVMVGGMR